MEINDKSTPGTPLLRLDTAVQYDNLWQREHQIGFDYNFSPQEMKSDGTSRIFTTSRWSPVTADITGCRSASDRACGENYENLPVDFRLR